MDTKFLLRHFHLFSPAVSSRRIAAVKGLVSPVPPWCNSKGKGEGMGQRVTSYLSNVRTVGLCCDATTSADEAKTKIIVFTTDQRISAIKIFFPTPQTKLKKTSLDLSSLLGFNFDGRPN